MKNVFTDHPHTVGESFAQHFMVATGFGSKMILGGIACCLHGFFPFAFTTTGSRTVKALYAKMSHGARQKIMENLPDGQQQPSANTQERIHEYNPAQYDYDFVI
jgi:Family of unknown function (DUF6356)